MLLAGLLNVFPSTLLAINGAVCGFGLLYVIPIFMHFSVSFGPGKKTVDPELLLTDEPNNGYSQQQIEVSGDNKMEVQPNKFKVYGVYGTLFVFGFVLAVLQLYQTFA